jgi:hypothetical protein
MRKHSWFIVLLIAIAAANDGAPARVTEYGKLTVI